MFFKYWHSQKQRRKLAKRAQGRDLKTRRAGTRPVVEALEDRCLLSNYFTNPDGGSWETAANWSANHVPQAGEAVLIGAKDVTVQLTSASSIASLSVGNGAKLVISEIPYVS